MSLFSKQKVFCQICGEEMETNFQSWKGRVCGRKCGKELEWRRTLSIMGKEYYPDPRKDEDSENG